MLSSPILDIQCHIIFLGRFPKSICRQILNSSVVKMWNQQSFFVKGQIASIAGYGTRGKIEIYYIVYAYIPRNKFP